MKRKFIITFVGALILLTVMSMGNGSQPALTKPEPKSVLRIGGLRNTEPFFFTDSGASFRGYNVEVMDTVAHRLGIAVEYQMVSYDALLPKLESGELDAAFSLGPGAMPGEFIASKPFIQNHFSIYVRGSNTSILSLEDLSGKKVAVCKSDPAYLMFQTREDIRLFICETQAIAFTYLKNGTADAYAANSDIASSYIEDAYYKKEVKMVGQKVNLVPSGLVFPPSQEGMAALINETLEEIEQDGTLEEIRTRWFGYREIQVPAYVYKILYGSLSFLVLLFLAFLIVAHINKLLKRQVDARTTEIKEEMAVKSEIMNSLFSSIVTLDTALVVTGRNHLLVESRLLDDREIVGRSIFDTQLMDIVKEEELTGAVEHRQKVVGRETTLCRDGREYAVEYNIGVIVIEGTVRGLAIAFKDVTEERSMRKRLIERDKMESVGRFAAGIAHEIRNPLTAIDMYLSLLPERIDDAGFRAQMTQDIRKETKRLNNLLKNLLDYTRPLPPLKEPLVLAEEIQFVLRLLGSEMERNGVRLETSIGTDTLFCDSQQLKQILINLLVNAIDGTRDCPDPVIRIQTKSAVDKPVITVYNSGACIPEESRSMIFDPFYTTKENGYGLGLSIVSQLCRENDLQIVLNHQLASGVEFQLIGAGCQR